MSAAAGARLIGRQPVLEGRCQEDGGHLRTEGRRALRRRGRGRGLALGVGGRGRFTRQQDHLLKSLAARGGSHTDSAIGDTTPV
jgi:hypothetical protein